MPALLDCCMLLALIWLLLLASPLRVDCLDAEEVAMARVPASSTSPWPSDMTGAQSSVIPPRRHAHQTSSMFYVIDDRFLVSQRRQTELAIIKRLMYDSKNVIGLSVQTEK